MRTTGWLAVVLFALASAGCASGDDWITRTQTLVNVTGRWDGTYEARASASNVTKQIRLTLWQNGPKVKGQGVLSTSEFSVDGAVEGEVFSGQIGPIRFDLTVTGNEMNEMTGRAEGSPLVCPGSCRVKLNRVGAAE